MRVAMIEDDTHSGSLLCLRLEGAGHRWRQTAVMGARPCRPTSARNTEEEMVQGLTLEANDCITRTVMVLTGATVVVEQDDMDTLRRLLHECFDFVVTGNSLPGLSGVALVAGGVAIQRRPDRLPTALKTR